MRRSHTCMCTYTYVNIQKARGKVIWGEVGKEEGGRERERGKEREMLVNGASFLGFFSGM